MLKELLIKAIEKKIYTQEEIISKIEQFANANKITNNDKIELYNLIGITEIPEISLETLKQNKINQIKSICNAEILDGFESTAKGGVLAYYGLDYEDQINLEALKNNVALGLIPEATLEYYAKGHPCEPWSNEEFMSLYVDAMNFKTILIRKAKDLISQIVLATTKEELDVITW